MGTGLSVRFPPLEASDSPRKIAVSYNVLLSLTAYSCLLQPTLVSYNLLSEIDASYSEFQLQSIVQLWTAAPARAS